MGIKWTKEHFNSLVKGAKDIYDNVSDEVVSTTKSAKEFYRSGEEIKQGAKADAIGSLIYSYLESEDKKKSPESKKARFEKLYKSMTDTFNNPFVDNPVQPCSAARTLAKAQRREARLGKIKYAEDYAALMPDGREKDKILNAASRFKLNIDEIEYARAANHTYLKYGDHSEMPENLKKIANSAPEGMLPVSPAELKSLGLKPEDLAPSTSDLRVAVFKLDEKVWKDKKGNNYVVAFRGSTTEEDWQTDIRQDWNVESDHYRRAVYIGETLSASEPGKKGKVHITGQSLGGGLASAASEAGQIKASTYNAAGLDEKTVARYSANPKKFYEQNQIKSFYVKGEFLSKIQKTGLADKAVGNRIKLEPHDPSLGMVDKHFTENVIFAFEKVKQEDEAILTSFC